MNGLLAHRTVLVTRAEEDAPGWIQALEDQGARGVALPCIVCEPVRDSATAAALRAAVETADWLVVTSRRGVDAAADLLGTSPPETVRIAVVGPATARAAEQRFGRVDLEAPDGTGEGLARALAGRLAARSSSQSGKVVVAAADRARPHVEAALKPEGHEVIRIAVYRTLPASPRTPRRDLEELGIDTILLASPSAVEGLLHLAKIPSKISIISIGPSTTEAARAAGLDVTSEAKRPTLEGLLEVIP